MAIDFTLTNEQQRAAGERARASPRTSSRPLCAKPTPSPIRCAASRRTKAAYVEAYKRASRSPCCRKEYGGGGLSNVDLIIAAEEICAVDPGFACTVLVNGLGSDAGLVLRHRGAEGPLPAARRPRDPTGEYIVGYAASEPAGSPGGTANFDAPLSRPAGIGVTATLDGDEYVLNGRKYWPCNVGGWDGKGANLNLVVVRTDPEQGRHRGAVGDHRRARHAGRHLQPHQQDRPAADARTRRSSSTTRACRPAT